MQSLFYNKHLYQLLFDTYSVTGGLEPRSMRRTRGIRIPVWGSLAWRAVRGVPKHEQTPLARPARAKFVAAVRLPSCRLGRGGDLKRGISPRRRKRGLGDAACWAGGDGNSRRPAAQGRSRRQIPRGGKEKSLKTRGNSRYFQNSRELREASGWAPAGTARMPGRRSMRAGVRGRGERAGRRRPRSPGGDQPAPALARNRASGGAGSGGKPQPP